MNHMITLYGSQFILRKAALPDVEVILQQRRKMYLDMGYRNEDALKEMIINCRGFLPRLIAEGKYHGWLLERDTREIVGGGGIFLYDGLPTPSDPQTNRPLIMNVYTEPACRRKGLARLLMGTMLDWCRERGFRSVVLHASDEGRPLYESLGFEQTSEMRLKLQ